MLAYVLQCNRMYRSVGKVFMLNSKTEIDTLLDTQTEERQKAETQLKGKQVLSQLTHTDIFSCHYLEVHRCTHTHASFCWCATCSYKGTVLVTLVSL
jgi:hypothetical protein